LDGQREERWAGSVTQAHRSRAYRVPEWVALSRCEHDDAEHGIADSDGLREQTLRARFGDASAVEGVL
jgi:hypothetical protein